ncbi:Rab3 GTPase-activating protein non-catalytic subunit [Geranomyces variabilis]|uniref:Rab3 GTPase-activating protein non-catalytic subunit n=1 Tax=Geranomyces variabilis TaxID=109894 RepID=A0AAD5XJ57_9FUNG|nr:Rab3 GTPase-activating protein non-catalytic subunit [Geranomyces variabilis]
MGLGSRRFCWNIQRRGDGYRYTASSSDTSVEDEYLPASAVVKFDDDKQVRDDITAMLCLPLFVPSTIRSRPANISLLVIVGFRSGCFKIYDETGSLCMSHLLNPSPIISIKLRAVTAISLVANAEPDADEVLIVHDDKTAVSIDGPSLWMAVKVVAGHREIGEYTEQPSLTYSKWMFSQQREIKDLVSFGPAGATVIAPAAFNPTSGTFAETRQSARFIGVGRPMITFYGTSVSRQSYSLKNVASKVSQAVTSAVLSFAKTVWTHTPSSLTGATTSTTVHNAATPSAAEAAAAAAAAAVPPPILVPPICTLSDPQRRVSTITLSPACPRTGRTPPLAALTDNLGRVLLVDVEEGEIIRIWKGMRDAQCGWQQVWSAELARVQLMLVIYTARGVLEVFCVRHGPRRSAVFVGQDMRLVQTAGGVLGAAYGGSSTALVLASCLLISPTGVVRPV